MKRRNDRIQRVPRRAHGDYGEEYVYPRLSPTPAGRIIKEQEQLTGESIPTPQLLQSEVEFIAVALALVSDFYNEPGGKLMFTLATELPVTGSPAAILASIDNVDTDGDGLLDVDQILGTDRDFVFTMEDVGVSSSYHVMTTLYVEGGGQFQPVPGVDYMAASELVPLGAGQVRVDLELAPVPAGP